MPPTTHTAIQGVCAWPNLQLLPNDTVLAFLFNQPCHGRWEGDLDCWASEDGGWTWRFRGRPAPHEPGTNRMNAAAGHTADGALLVACSGHSDRGPVGEARWFEHSHPLTAWISRSADDGRTWERIADLPESGLDYPYIPFGDVLPGADGALRLSTYTGDATWVLRSTDGGVTWGDPVLVRPAGGTETALLHLGAGRWLAACRVQPSGYLELLTSADDAHSWTAAGFLTLPGMHPAHLLRLADGRILLTYGNRCSGHLGIDIRLSADEGATWTAPARLAESPHGDSGYPATVQLSDGRLVTAYYTALPGEFQYEMRVTRWEAKDYSV